MKKIFLGLMACAALCACTDDIAVLASDADLGEGDSGSVVYLTVNIQEANSSTRADDGGFEYGTADEQKISNAHFYFYDAEGNYRAQGDATGITGTSSSEAEPADNIEFKSNTVVAVWGIEDTSVPKYMVTVLNQPKGFVYGRTLEDMAEVLANGNCGWQDESGNFVMSTSSFVDYGDVNEDTARPAYFVTEISESNFRSEPVNLDTDYEDDDDDVVQVYVERLAAKVEVDVDFTGIEGLETDETYGYLIPASHLGVNIITKVDSDGKPVEDNDDGSWDPSKCYVAISGWNLTGTARNSNIVKDITGFDISSGIDGWTGWNDPGNHRSYWGKSFNYDMTDGGPKGQAYPTSAVRDTVSQYTYGTNADYTDKTKYHNQNGNTFRGNYDDVEDSDVDTLWLNKYLKYSSLVNPIAFGGCAYCSENTNTTTVLEKKTSSAITNVILKGQFGSYDNGTFTPVDLVYYNGSYYTVDAFKDHIAARVIAYDFNRLLEEQLGDFASYLSGLRQTVYVKKLGDDEEADANYIPFDGRFVKLMDWGDGKVSVRMETKTPEGYGQNTTKFYPSDKYWHVYDMEVDCVSEAKESLDDYDIYLIYDGSYVMARLGEVVLDTMGIDCTLVGNALTNLVSGAHLYAKFGGDSDSSADRHDIDKNGSYYTWRNYMLWEMEREAWELNWWLEKEGGIVPCLYANGLMYYNAPIEHLSDQSGPILEGQYGIVRNHLYKVTIDDVAKLGTPIANEKSVIVPQDKDLQYLGARVNVLSWKVVEQNLDFTDN